jgi:hypothetical protein
MSVRPIQLAGAISISLTVLGCATNPSASTDELPLGWRLAKERQQQAARDAGRIGYIGNAGGTAMGISR